MEFAGWELPVQFTSVIAEHKAVRSQAGLFDISHMAQVFVEGPASLAWLQRMVTNDVAQTPPGRGLYAYLCNEQGGVVDDIYVFRLNQNRFFLVMNASREEAGLGWLRRHIDDGVDILPRGDRGALALQGPLASEIVTAIFPPAANLGRNEIAEIETGGRQVLVSRTGYTGEDGFEVFSQGGGIQGMWNTLWQAGAPLGMVPAGLGARDTLRLEAGYPLYGHELDEDTSPFEIGYGWAVKLDKDAEFPGSDALRREEAQGSKRKLIGLSLIDRGVPREGCPVYAKGSRVGQTTSGTFSPSLERGICMALVDSREAGPFSIELHGRRLAAEHVKLPFYRRERG